MAVKKAIEAPIKEGLDKQDILNVKAVLEAQPKVRVKIPFDPLNKGDTVVPVGVNGYFLDVPRGETVEVPETVADILTNAGYI